MTLHSYINSRRQSTTMINIARKLSPLEIQFVSTYLSSKKFCSIDVIIDAKDGIMIEGKTIVQRGGCRNCHGQNFQGLAGPRLAGQKTDYLIKALQGYKTQSRRTHSPMTQIFTNYSRQDISDIAAYLNSLKSKVCN
ncbi:MAG: c-type cytochrome [Bdellovibrionales bacterium]|nr:c-type cytochrome [Bdellovibrionales bacterium]